MFETWTPDPMGRKLIEDVFRTLLGPNSLQASARILLTVLAIDIVTVGSLALLFEYPLPALRPSFLGRC